MGKKIIYEKFARGSSTIYRPKTKPTLFQLLQLARQRVHQQQNK